MGLHGLLQGTDLRLTFSVLVSGTVESCCPLPLSTYNALISLQFKHI
jgi:hypothetical protein